MSLTTPGAIEIVKPATPANPSAEDTGIQYSVDVPEKDANAELNTLKKKAVNRFVSTLKGGRENLVCTVIWLVLASEPDKRAYWAECTEPYNNGNSNKYLSAVKVCTDGGQDIPPSTLTNMSYVTRCLYSEVKDHDIKDDKASFDFIMDIFKKNGYQKGCIEKLFGKKDLLKGNEPMTRPQVEEIIENHIKDDVSEIGDFETVSDDFDDKKLVVLLARYSDNEINVIDTTQSDAVIDYIVRKLHKS
jgi:hypothetical protein